MQDAKAQHSSAVAPELSAEQQRVMDARKKLAERFGSTSTRLGGKGTPKRKHKVVHHSSSNNDKQTKDVIKKLQAQPLQDLNEVNMFTSEMKVMQFKNPEVFGNLPNQTFIVCGNPEEKTIKDNLPEFITQLSESQVSKLKSVTMAEMNQTQAEGAEEVPELVNFEDEAQK